MDLPPPPRSDDPEALARLREAIEAAGYTHDGLMDVLGLEGPSPTAAASSNQIKRVKAELYCERMEIKMGPPLVIVEG